MPALKEHLKEQLSPASMTFDEFMAWYEHQEGHWELHDGVPVRKHDPARGQSERLRHLDAKAGIFMALHKAVTQAGKKCHVVPDGATVKISDSVSYEPDALVYCGERHDGNRTDVPDPLIVVEVLSPSTAQKDMTDKLRDYFTLPGIRHYLVLDPVKEQVWHYCRNEAQEIVVTPVQSGTLVLEPPGLTVELAEVFS